MDMKYRNFVATVGSPLFTKISSVPYRTVPYRIVPYRTLAQQTVYRFKNSAKDRKKMRFRYATVDAKLRF